MGAHIGAPRAEPKPQAPAADTVFTWKDDYIRRASDHMAAGLVRAPSVLNQFDGLREILSGASVNPSMLIPESIYLEPRFTPLRNAIPRQAAHGNAVEFRPESNYGLSARFSADDRFANGFRLMEVSLVPADHALFGPIEFADPAFEPYIQRTTDQLRRLMRGQEEKILLTPPASRIEVVSQPAIYDPSNPDHWRAYVRQLRQAGLSADAIARWCPALAWSQIAEVLG